MFFKKQKPTTESTQDELRSLIKTFSLFKQDISSLGAHDHYDLIEETVMIRQNIHECVQDISPLDESVRQQIRDLDRAWREWIVKNKRNDFTLVDIDRNDISHSQWWFWIDQLDNLKAEDFETI